MTRNQWLTETIETIRTSGLTLIISSIWFFKTFTAEFGRKIRFVWLCTIVKMDFLLFDVQQ